jgi:hypothetical protein
MILSAPRRSVRRCHALGRGRPIARSAGVLSTVIILVLLALLGGLVYDRFGAAGLSVAAVVLLVPFLLMLAGL